MAFSATNVGIWRVAVGVERGYSGGAVLQLADRWTRASWRAGRAAGQRSLPTWAGVLPASRGCSVTPSGGCGRPRIPLRSGSGTARRSAERSRTCSIAPPPRQAARSCGAWLRVWACRTKPDVPRFAAGEGGDAGIRDAREAQGRARDGALAAAARHAVSMRRAVSARSSMSRSSRRAPWPRAGRMAAWCRRWTASSHRGGERPGPYGGDGPGGERVAGRPARASRSGCS